MTSDFLEIPGPVGPPIVGSDRPVGIVSKDADRIAVYLEVPVGDYVIIRDVRDVPDVLGGLALLDDEPVPLDLAQALSRALLNEG